MPGTPINRCAHQGPSTSPQACTRGIPKQKPTRSRGRPSLTKASITSSDPPSLMALGELRKWNWPKGKGEETLTKWRRAVEKSLDETNSEHPLLFAEAARQPRCQQWGSYHGILVSLETHRVFETFRRCSRRKTLRLSSYKRQMYMLLTLMLANSHLVFLIIWPSTESNWVGACLYYGKKNGWAWNHTIF